MIRINRPDGTYFYVAGHINDAGGYCSEWHGNTCGCHPEYEVAKRRFRDVKKNFPVKKGEPTLCEISHKKMLAILNS